MNLEHFSDIIQAVDNPVALGTLIILVVSSIAVIFFRNDRTFIRIVIFFALTFGCSIILFIFYEIREEIERSPDEAVKMAMYSVLDTSPQQLRAVTNGEVISDGQNYGVQFLVKYTTALTEVSMYATQNTFNQSKGVFRIWRDTGNNTAASTPLHSIDVDIYRNGEIEGETSGSIYTAKIDIILNPGTYWASLSSNQVLNQYIMTNTKILGDQFSAGRPNLGTALTPGALQIVGYNIDCYNAIISGDKCP